MQIHLIGTELKTVKLESEGIDLNQGGVMTVRVDRFCFCKKGLMSVCTAVSVEEQNKCRYYQKSSRSDCCMYLAFDYYCDCLEAQMNGEEQDAPEVL